MLRCAITAGQLACLPDPGERASALASLVARSRQLARDGVELLIVREKELLVGELTQAAREIVAAVSGSASRVLVAGRVDVALAAGAAGVHLAAADGELHPGQVRRVLPKAFVSVSCHTVDQVRRASEAGADAVLFAPVFGKWTGSQQVSVGVGVDRLREAVEAAPGLPVFALGGVRKEDFAACRDAGARGVAGIRLFFG